jgi:hypothetical protein
MLITRSSRIRNRDGLEERGDPEIGSRKSHSLAALAVQAAQQKRKSGARGMQVTSDWLSADSRKTGHEEPLRKGGRRDGFDWESQCLDLPDYRFGNAWMVGRGTPN